VTRWLKTHYAEIYQREIANLAPQYDKFLSFIKDYVKKQWDGRKNQTKIIVLKKIYKISISHHSFY
jgi:hypothetical protein